MGKRGDVGELAWVLFLLFYSIERGSNPIYDSGLGKDALVCDIIVRGSWQRS